MRPRRARVAIARIAAISLLGGLLIFGSASCGGTKPPHPPPVHPTPTASPTATPSATSEFTAMPSPTYTWSLDIVDYVEIGRIKYKGDIPFTEPDEYVTIRNVGDAPVNLEGWVLKNITAGYPNFSFPWYILYPDASCRVYTDEYHRDWGGFEFDSKVPVWNNTSPDTAALYDSRGNLISEKSYTGE